MSDYANETEEPDVFVRDKMVEARERLFEAIEHHEQVEHDGEPCTVERVSMVAFLAHAAGLRGDALPLFVRALAEYQATHEAHHGKNGNGHV